MNNIPIKVGYLVSYDYEYLKISLPTIYENADEIYLAIDKDKKTWTGGDIEIPESFFEWIKQYDTDHKIKIYEESFYEPELSPMECETRERNMLAQYMGQGGWYIQIDADEYFIDFESFVEYLKSLDITKPYCIYVRWATVFKIDKNNYFLIKERDESTPIATNQPNYTNARHVDHEKYNIIYTQFSMIHQSWGRTEADLLKKLKNWGHSDDFDVEEYFNFWKNVNKYVYKYIQNFHPVCGHYWKKLELVKANSIAELIEIEEIKQKQENKNPSDKSQKKKSLFGLFSKKK